MAEDMKFIRKFHIEKYYVDNPLKLGDMQLFQIGRTHCTKDSVIDTHIHRNWIELTQIFEGNGYVITNGVCVPIKAGEIFLSFPGDIHAINTDINKPLKYNFLSFWTNNEALLSEIEEIMFYNSDPTKRIFTNKDIEYLIGNSISEVFLNDEYSNDILVSAFNQILRYLIREFKNHQSNRKLSVTSAHELCYQMMNYISTHIYAIDTLDSIAEYFGYSYSYLSNLFHKITGDTLIQYYTIKRLDIAAILIKEDQLSIGEISELLKYSSIYTFSRAFKKRFGECPTDYRKNIINI